MRIDAGSVAAGVLLVSAIVSPPTGAPAVSVTVAWTGTPGIETLFDNENV